MNTLMGDGSKLKTLYRKLFPEIVEVLRFKYYKQITRDLETKIKKRLIFRRTMKRDPDFINFVFKSPINIHASVNIPFRRNFYARAVFIDIDCNDISIVRKIADLFSADPFTIRTNRGFHCVYLFRRVANKADIIYIATKLTDFFEKQQKSKDKSDFAKIDLTTLVDLQKGIRVPYTAYVKFSNIHINYPVDSNGNILHVDEAISVLSRAYIDIDASYDYEIANIEASSSYSYTDRIPMYFYDKEWLRKIFNIILRIIRDEQVSHNERIDAVAFLRVMGFTKEEIFSLFKHRSDFDEHKTRYYINWVFDHRYYPRKYIW